MLPEPSPAVGGKRHEEADPVRGRQHPTRAAHRRQAMRAPRTDSGVKMQEQPLQEHGGVDVAREAQRRLVDGFDRAKRGPEPLRGDLGLGEPVPAHCRERGEPGADLVGAYPSQLAAWRSSRRERPGMTFSPRRSASACSRAISSPCRARTTSTGSAIEASSSSAIWATLAPVPSNRPGTIFHRCSRAAKPGSRASNLARSRRPPATSATACAVATSTPSPISTSMIVSSPSGLNGTCTHRLAIVTNGLGIVSAVMIITVVSGGSSIVFSNAGAASSTRWKSAKTSTWYRAALGVRRARRATSRCLFDQDGGPYPLDHLEIGMPQSERLPAGRTLATTSLGTQEGGREGDRRLEPAAPGRAQEEVGVQGCAERAAENADRFRLSFHAVEDRSRDRRQRGGHRGPSMPRRARTAASTSRATCGRGRRSVDDDPARRRRPRPSCGSPRSPSCGTPVPRLRSGPGSHLGAAPVVPPGAAPRDRGACPRAPRGRAICRRRLGRRRGAPPRSATGDRSPGRRASSRRNGPPRRVGRLPEPAR